MWIVYAFGSAFLAGITAILAKCGMQRTDSHVATALRTMVVLVFAWGMVFLTGGLQGITLIDSRSLLFLILSGLSTGGSWLCYFKALQRGDVNKVAVVDKSSTVLTILLAFLLLREDISLTKWIGMIAIGLGTYGMIERKETLSSADSGRSWLFYAALSALFAGLTAILGKIGISGVDSNLGTAIRTVVVAVMAWLVVLATGKQHTLRRISKRELAFIGLSGVATGGSWLCYYKALQDGPASVVVPIDKLSILVTVAFSLIVFHEKISKKAACGLLLMTAGTLIMLVPS